MPNHATQTIRIKGDIAKLIERGFITPGLSPGVDFNAIIPMPESLNMTSGSETDLGLAALAGGREWEFLRSMPWYEDRYPGCDDRWKLVGFLQKHNPEALKLGEQAMENLRRHGSTTWYEWCTSVWGTKWNAYNVTEVTVINDTIAIAAFQTAWNPPFPVYDKLREEGYEVDGLYHDEYDNGVHAIGEGHDVFSSNFSFTYEPWLDEHMAKKYAEKGN